ncbi:MULTISPECIES: hypothetical protein [unclassified Arthrobacter]|uniref:hypothetical protein n=1 Tax=unclassified Arthrobacter TaxID=235627 RepID=UPI00339882AF
MLKEAKANVTRIRALDQLHPGDEIEARLAVGPNYDDVVIRRGSVQETAPGIGVVWIMDHHTGSRKAINTDECSVWRLARLTAGH